jgi:4-carboxymuconolactone decarboxylase
VTNQYGNSLITRLPSDDTLVGPFGIILHHPAVGHAFLNISQALRTIPGFSTYAREVAIAVVGAKSQAAYENYAHRIIGVHEGLSPEEMQMLNAGKCPETLTEEGKVAFEVASRLVDGPGPLATESWDRALRTFGKDGAAALVHYVGFYRYVSTVLNGFDAQVPTSDMKTSD